MINLIQGRKLTDDDRKKVAAMREEFKNKPSIDELLESGKYMPPITMGQYFDMARCGSARLVQAIIAGRYLESVRR